MRPLVLLGVVVLVLRRRAWAGFLSLLAAEVAALALMAVTFYSLERFQLPLVPFIVVLAALGVEAAASYATGADLPVPPPRRIQAAIRGAVIAAALIGMAVDGVVANVRGSADILAAGAVSSTAWDRSTARDLAETLPAGASLMCNKPWLAVEAGLDWRSPPWTPPDRMLAYAIANRVDYALIGPWQIEEVYGRIETTVLGPLVVKTFTGADTLYLVDFSRAGGGALQPGRGPLGRGSVRAGGEADE
jgi:hypothetical protein